VLPRVQRPDQQADDAQQRRHAEYHDEPERQRGGEQQDRHDHDRGDRAAAPGGDVQHAADVADVGGADADDLARGDPPRQAGADPVGVPDGELHRAVRGRQPVDHRVAVSDDAGHRLHGADRQQHAGPAEQGAAVAGREPGVDGLADDRRHQRLAAHPHDGQQRAGDQRPPLGTGQPHQVAGGRPGVRGAGIGDG
jgi:hypothetical protein